LEGSGIRTVAISADTPEESRDLCQRAGFTFPILSDSNTQTTRQYDLLLPGSGENGRDISGAAEFLIDTSGTVRWRKLSEAGPEKFLEAAKKLNQ
jgi:peroxiredoxin